MRSLRLTVLLVLTLGLILAMGCSSSNGVTEPIASPEPTIDPEIILGRDADWGWGGNGWGGGGWWDDFETDCERLFDVDYFITTPSGYEWELEGEVNIRDEDCDATESEVRVDFKFILGFGGYHDWVYVRTLPGDKTYTDDGILYSGEYSYSWEHWGWEGEFSREFELLVFEEEREDSVVETVIEGWIHRRSYFSWEWNDEQYESEHIWHTDITGVEVVE